MGNVFDLTEASYKRTITYYQKAKTIYNLLGLEDKAKLTDIIIANLKDRLARCDEDVPNVVVNASTKLEDAR